MHPVIPLGDPFCYLARSREPQRPPAAPSTIVYPLHGWEQDDIVGSHDALIAAISDREEQPVTVCLYWREFDQLDVRRRYEAAGFRVITHGYRDDPLFTLRQYDELCAHTRIVTNRAATAFWRGALMGLESEIYGPVFSILGRDEAAEYGRYQRSRWPELCSSGLDGTRARELAVEELGWHHVLDVDELIEVLGWNDPAWRRFGTHMASRSEFHVRRVVYNVRLRLPRSEPLPRF